MPRQLDWLDVTVKGLGKKYKLSEPFMVLLERLWDHQNGASDPSALGRLMRLSEHMRTICTDTVAQLAQAIQTNPDTASIRECTSLISKCTELLAMANQPFANNKFPFMKLPVELRSRVYQHYFANLFNHTHDRVLYRLEKIEGCRCIPMFEIHMRGFVAWKIDLALARVSKALRDEVLPAWYTSKNMYMLNCTCQLKHLLTKNKIMAQYLKNLRIHWSGPDAAEAFKLLSSVPLKALVVVVSKSTTNHLSERESALQIFFAHKGPRRLTDAAGFEELFQLRGVDRVEVHHINKIQGNKRTDQERIELQCLLEHYMKSPN